MRLTWATDVHLDFITNLNSAKATARNFDIFCSFFKKESCDAIVLSGDISIAMFLQDHLLALEERLKRPIYFVLGNHDFWGDRTMHVRKMMTELSNRSEYLKYLSAIPYVQLNKDIFMVGHDGWYDGLYGDPRLSSLVMNDWTQIGDYVDASSPIFRDKQIIDSAAILTVAREQALLATRHVTDGIKSLLSRRSPRKIIVVTHVPPFTQPLDLSGSFKDRGTKQDVYPWYTSKTMGDMLLSVANSNLAVQFEVLCGHCHVKCDEYITSNLFLRSGVAEYYNPKPQLTFDISS